MSSIDSEWTRKLKEVENERDLWKEKYLNVSKMYNEILAKHETSEFQRTNESTSDEESPSKRQRIDQEENFQDPLKLPEPCIQNILQYFSGKELLTLTEVSTHWKNYIESSNFLMNRAMDNVVACFDKDNNLFVYEGSIRPLNRRYKHARAVFPQAYFKSIDAMDHAVFGRYENSFESLTLSVLDLEENFHIPIKPVSFSKLKMLQLEIDSESEDEWPQHNLAFERFIKYSSFPEVTKLYYHKEVISNDFVTEFLCKFPKLIALFISSYTATSLIDENLSITRFEQQPKLKFIGLQNFSLQFLQTFSETLSSVYIQEDMGKHEINILLNLPILEFLRISLDHDSESEDEVLYTRNQKLKTLLVKEESIEEVHELLLAVPNLEVLILETMKVTTSTINFLASNMFNLKRLVCSEISVEALNDLSNLQQNEENRFANTAFSLGVAPHTDSIHDLEKLFKGI